VKVTQRTHQEWQSLITGKAEAGKISLYVSLLVMQNAGVTFLVSSNVLERAIFCCPKIYV
jgi:hypothetical protein